MEPLTKDDIKAIRAADSLGFSVNGSAKIICRKKVKIDGFNTELTREIEVSGHISGKNTGEHSKAYSSALFAQDNNHVRTAIESLRVKDEVSIEFYGDGGTNQYLENATTGHDCGSYHGIHLDLLIMRIRRQDSKRLQFLLAYSACPMNSARMIQP